MKKALVTGVTGQCGSYLAELLLDKGYEVYGTLRRSSSFNTGRIDHIFDQLKLSYVDLADAGSIQELIRKIQPDEIFNLAAQSHVKVSFDVPDYTCDIVALGNLRLLEAIRNSAPEARFYQASSSEMFGSSPTPQNEDTVFSPRSPYGAAKLHAYHMTRIYRDGYGLFSCNGILFNTESPRRGHTFVTKKITTAAARIKLGLQDKLFLGNLDAKRDWGFAPEYVEGMWRMLQQDEPDDYVLATGRTHTIREFLDAAFAVVDLDWRQYVEVDPKYYRPAEVDILQGDATKAKQILGWEAKTMMPELAALMVKADYELLGK